MTEFKRRSAYLSSYNFGWQTAVYRLTLGANLKRLLDIGLDGAFIETKTFALPKRTNMELVRSRDAHQRDVRLAPVC